MAELTDEQYQQAKHSMTLICQHMTLVLRRNLLRQWDNRAVVQDLDAIIGEASALRGSLTNGRAWTPPEGISAPLLSVPREQE